MTALERDQVAWKDTRNKVLVVVVVNTVTFVEGKRVVVEVVEPDSQASFLTREKRVEPLGAEFLLPTYSS